MTRNRATLFGMTVMVVGAIVTGVSLLGVVVGQSRPGAGISSPHASPDASTAAAASPQARAYDHVVVVMLENRSFESVIGNGEAPYLNSLASKNSLATDYTGVTHPSLPNYLALTGGSTFGVTSDCGGCFVTAPNLADRVEAAGLTWRAYNESMPSPCFSGDAYPYAQKHNPFYYYNSIRQTPSRCANIVPLSVWRSDFAAATTAPAFSLVTPNLCNDGHDCSLSTTDRWLAAFVPSLLSSPAFTSSRSLLVVTYDEAEGGSGRVVTVLAGTGVRSGFTSARHYDHYSLLRTVEDSLGLASLGRGDQSAVPMSDFLSAG